MKLQRATRIGLIAGIVLILVSISIYAIKKDFDTPLQYIPYAIYLCTIIFTQYKFSGSSADKHSISNYFSEGFKTFIVITLVMTIFTMVFIAFTPQLSEAAGENTRHMLEAEGNKTGAEIEAQVKLSRKNYPNAMTSMVIFGYLAIGSLTALIGGLYFSRKYGAGKSNT